LTSHGSFARVDFTDAPAGRSEPPAAAEDSRSMLITRTRARAAETGRRRRPLPRDDVDYANTRIQFGRPIGKFQAIKHLCADMLIEVEGARAALTRPSKLQRQQRTDAPLVAVVASTEARARCTSSAREHPHPRRDRLHMGTPSTLYFRRAKSSQMMFRRTHDGLRDDIRNLLTVERR